MTTSIDPTPGRYTLQPSTIRFETRHLFGLAPVRGQLTATAGALMIGASPSQATATATIDARSFTTGNPLRDGQVRSRIFLNAKRQPAFNFRSQSVTSTAEGWKVRGTLEVRGSSAPVELLVAQITEKGAALTIRARGEIDRYAHGVKAFKGMAARKLAFEVEATATRV